MERLVSALDIIMLGTAEYQSEGLNEPVPQTPAPGLITWSTNGHSDHDSQLRKVLDKSR